MPHRPHHRRQVSRGGVRFFELGTLSVEQRIAGRGIGLKLSDFVIPLDDAREEARTAIKHRSQTIGK